jgi:hypothetical protein
MTRPAGTVCTTTHPHLGVSEDSNVYRATHYDGLNPMRSLVGSRLVRSALAAATFALADPSPAQAEWTFSAYLCGSKTASNTVRIEPETDSHPHREKQRSREDR